MESQPQNPELRINKCVISIKILCADPYYVGTERNCRILKELW